MEVVNEGKADLFPVYLACCGDLDSSVLRAWLKARLLSGGNAAEFPYRSVLAGIRGEKVEMG